MATCAHASAGTMRSAITPTTRCIKAPLNPLGLPAERREIFPDTRRVRRVRVAREIARERLARPRVLSLLIVEQAHLAGHLREIGIEDRRALVRGQRAPRELVAIGGAARALPTQPMEIAECEIGARIRRPDGDRALELFLRGAEAPGAHLEPRVVADEARHDPLELVGVVDRAGGSGG